MARIDVSYQCLPNREALSWDLLCGLIRTKLRKMFKGIDTLCFCHLLRTIFLFLTTLFLTMEQLRVRTERAKRNISSKKSRDGWILEKQPMTFADEYTWSNRDSDVTPLERRTWSSWTILGYWFSDVLSAQSWSGASAIIAVGLTW